ncbi:MAG: cobalamin biosynthesis protein CobW [Proteobacteria bacterium]|nr:cobalamin biosynthesis protein CobW [Pseudomonadota bacterium]
MGKIPISVVTGFLGAGKTTLIRHLLTNADGRRIALIINEFGDLGVDGDILKACGDETCTEDDIVELNNGCLCCTVADDFVPTLELLLNRPDKPDHIIIETSGLALPKPLLKAFQWPEVRSRTTVDGVITVIDGPAVASGMFASDPEEIARLRLEDPSLDHDDPLEELYEDQLACADLVVLNKIDLLDAADQERVREQIGKETRGSVEIVMTQQGEIKPSFLLGLAAAAEDDLDARPSHHDALDGDHEHDDFDSFVLRLDPVTDVEAFVGRVTAALNLEGVLRIKGFGDVDGKPARLIVQGVGPRLTHYYDRPWAEGENRATQLVVIGLNGIDHGEIEAVLRPVT